MTESGKELKAWRGANAPVPVTLEGRWVRLEPLDAEAHAEEIWKAVAGQDHVWDWLGDGPYPTAGELKEALAAKQAGTAARFFAIRPKSASGQTGAAVGYASLMRIDPSNGVIEVGNVMFAPPLQRTQAATEAMYLMARHIFEDLGYRRYEWKCNGLNLPSRRAAVRLGFTFEGVFKQHMIVKGRNRDTAWFAMLDGEWPERKKAFEAWLDEENFDGEGRQITKLNPNLVNG